MTNQDRPQGRTSRTPSRATVIGATVALLLAAIGVLGPSQPASAYTTVFYNGAAGAPKMGIIGDSSLAGIRWSNAYGPLKRFNYTFDAESCRRTTTASCRGRESYAPENAITTLRRLSGQWGDVLVMVTGYNDPGSSFANSVDVIMAEAANQGIPKVIWLTMRTAEVSYVSPGYSSNSYTFRDNNRILLQKSQQYGGSLQIADWASYSAGRSDWVTSDGVHTRGPGSFAQAQFIADSAGYVFAGFTITPPPPPNLPPGVWVNVRRGDRGSRVAMVQSALMGRGIALVGGADGVFGQYTEAAVVRFQGPVGLPANGIVDAATAQQLGIYNGPVAPPPPPSAPTWTNVAIGARGSTVAAIQRAVMNAGIYLRGGADGVFGQYTRAAVATYQSQRGLPASGAVDAATAQAMGLYTPPAVAGASGEADVTARATAAATPATATPATAAPATEVPTTQAGPSQESSTTQSATTTTAPVTTEPAATTTEAEPTTTAAATTTTTLACTVASTSTSTSTTSTTVAPSTTTTTTTILTEDDPIEDDPTENDGACP